MSGDALRAIRLAAGVTVRELAARSGIGEEYLRRVEVGDKRATPHIVDAYEALRKSLTTISE